MGLLNSAIEEQKKAGLLNRSAGAAPAPEPRRIVPATIQAPKQGFLGKLASQVSRAIPAPIKEGVDTFKDALFGNPRDRAVLQQMEDEGQPIDFVTRLKVEGFLPFLGKGKAEEISENVVHLTNKGVDPARAEELAFYDAFKQGLPFGAPKEAGDRLKSMEPTKEEERVLGIARLGNTIGGALDVGGILPVGAISRQGVRLTTGAVVRTKSAQEALTLLTKARVEEDVAAKFADAIAAARTSDEAQVVLDKVIDTQLSRTAATKGPLVFTKNAQNLTEQIIKKYPDTPPRIAESLADDAVKLVKEGANTPKQAMSLIKEQIFNMPVSKTAKVADDVAPLIAEAKKFKTADEFISKVRGSATQYGEYSPQLRLSGTAPGQKRLPELGIDPEETVTIYRGIDDTTGKIPKKINDGDFVTTDYDSAWSYAGDNVVSMEVKAKDLILESDEADFLEDPFFTGAEYIYSSKKAAPMKTDAELLEIFNQANGTAAPKTLENRGISTRGIQQLQREGKPPSPEAVSDAFDNKYTAGDGVPETLEKSLGDSAITTMEPTLHKRVAETLKKGLTSVVEFVQDTDKRILDLQKTAMVTDESNIYQKLTLMPGRLGTIVEEGRTVVKDVLQEMGDLAKKEKIELPAIRKDVNDYLLVKHAPERNAALGDKAAGISTEAAIKRMDELKASPHFAKIQEFANKLSDLNTKTLDMLRDSGVISDELFTTLREKYKSHVPLNRLFDESEDVGEILSGRGLDVRSSGIKRAVGSEREVADIVENIVVNYEQAAIRSEKNIVDQATLQFVRDNPSDLFTIKKPKPIGESFDGRPLMEKTQDPNILQMFENGKPVWIEIHDPHLAAAMRGVGREKLGMIMNAVASFTRLYSGLATRFNPEFAFPNKVRDLQEVMIYLSAQKDVGAKSALKTAVRDPISLKAITDSIRGVDSEGARLYTEMKRMGGTTGGMGLSTRKKVELDIRKLEKLAQSKPRQFAEGVIEYVDHWNTIFEDSSRLSVYRSAIEKGLSKERAAFLAKEASVNFNRMGKGGPVINGLYMFANASIQGSTKMIRSLRNPKVLAGTVAVVGSSVAAINQWNDQVDPEWRERISKWDRLNSLPVALPSEDGTIRYITIPVSWGVKPIKVMADYAYDAAAGKGFDGAKAAEDVFTAIAEAYNPMGGSDALSAATPTILDIPFEIGRNLSWTGGPIKPDRDPYAPESIKYFDSLEKKASGRAAISLSEMLSGAGIEVSPADLNYAYDGYISGAGRFITKNANALVGAFTGNLPPINEFPFLSRFYKEKLEDEVFNTEANEAIAELMSGDKKEKFYIQKQAEEEWANLEGLTPEEKKDRLRAIAQENPDLVEKILDVGEAEKLGLTGKEKQLKFATVAVRAEFIANELAKAKNKEEKKQIILNYREKKILTDSVLDAMEELLAK